MFLNASRLSHDEATRHRVVQGEGGLDSTLSGALYDIFVVGYAYSTVQYSTVLFWTLT